ncbi:MAG: hypothetical protein ABL898_09485 [Hyphomicrobiaceae bacterium]
MMKLVVEQFGFRRHFSRAVALATVMLASLAVAVTAAPVGRDFGWATYTSPGFDLNFDYPARVFTTVDEDPTSELEPRIRDRAGRTFSTADGRATLQVGAFQNVDRLDASGLRARALKTSYVGAQVEYDRLAPNWFVLSGRRADEMFYERVTVTCGGRRIDVWQMSYPMAERAFFDRVVEDMARKYRLALANIKC